MVIFSGSLCVTSGVTSEAKLCFLPVHKKTYKTSIICFYCVNYVRYASQLLSNKTARALENNIFHAHV